MMQNNEMEYWLKELKHNVSTLTELIQSTEKSKGYNKTINLQKSQDKLKVLTTTIRKTFVMELRQQTGQDKYNFQLKLEEVDKIIEKQKAKLVWLEKEVLLGEKQREPNALTQETGKSILLQETHKIQDKTEDSLMRTLKTAHEINDIGEETLGQMESQTKQIERVDQTVDQMEDELKKAEVLLRSMIRRIMTDKLILLFAGLIFFAIVGIIVYSTFKDDNENVNNPVTILPSE
eukprot:maker-scaffold_7-snap-gene-7.33-mRNA-1 protein AED:0.00 eAED:0.00 QI:225/1/1/1/1/1/2/322/233